MELPKQEAAGIIRVKSCESPNGRCPRGKSLWNAVSNSSDSQIEKTYVSWDMMEEGYKKTNLLGVLTYSVKTYLHQKLIW